MSELSDILSVMKWPLIACLILPGILVYLGLHIVRREIIFVDLALAQVAALGTCVAILLDHHHRFIELPIHLNLVVDGQPLGPVQISYSYFWSLGFTIIGAAIFTLTRNKGHHHVPQEALIGIVYVVAAALGILLLSNSTEGNEELRSTLIGDLLVVKAWDVIKTFLVFLAVGVVHFMFRKQFYLLSFEPEQAVAKGMGVRRWDFLFYVLFGVVVTSFVQIGGVLLVFTYLIVPAVCANFLANKLRSLLLIGWTTATLSSVAGVYWSYKKDLPTGAAVVCALGAALLIVGIFTIFRRKPACAPTACGAGRLVAPEQARAGDAK